MKTELFAILENLRLEDLQPLDEARAVTFNGQANPDGGWMVVMAGGAGSGKSFALENQILIQGRKIDVDGLKKSYAEYLKLTKGLTFDFKNPEDVSKLHELIDAKGWKDSIIEDFFLADTGQLASNIILDITGKNSDSLQEYANIAKAHNFKTSLVWVVANRQWAAIRNQLRSRVVPDTQFHLIHNQVAETLLNFLPDENLAKNFDEAWILFSGDVGEYTGEKMPTSIQDFFKGTKEVIGSVVKLVRKGAAFELPDDLKDKILQFMGPAETNPRNPEVYMKGSDIKDLINKNDRGVIELRPAMQGKVFKNKSTKAQTQRVFSPFSVLKGKE
jgi:predicted kinase